MATQGVDDDRRSYERLPLEAEVSLESDSQFFTGLTGDISQGGIFVSTYRVLPIGSAITVEFTLPEGKVTAQGVVRWLREPSSGAPPGVGIAFEPLAPADEAIIRAFCARRDPLYYDDD